MQTRFVTLPIAGSIRHGEQQERNGTTKPVELGHFVAKIKDTAMVNIHRKFNTVYNQSKILNIQFFDEEPLTIKLVRYNQGGTACYCLNGETKGKEKVQKKWVEKDCKEECQYRQGIRPQCNQEATLKFLIPEVSQDRIWYVKTKSFYSIQNISSYINLQKQLGNSLIGHYKLFLKPKESIIDGKTFNNFVLDIVKDDVLIPENTPQIEEKPSQIIPAQVKDNTQNTTSVESSEEVKKKQTKTAKQKSEPKPKIEHIDEPKKEQTTSSESKQDTTISDKKFQDDFERYYILLSTGTVLIDKKGKPTEYLEGTFVNKDEKEVKALLHPNFANEFKTCELGSQFLLDIQEVSGRNYVVNYECIQKYEKEAV
ncbi:MAG: hypothetical protein Q4G09_00935 [Clostridia bacterium]|nr:hypothetical protein [Clostridia bacterium]